MSTLFMLSLEFKAFVLSFEENPKYRGAPPLVWVEKMFEVKSHKIKNQRYYLHCIAHYMCNARAFTSVKIRPRWSKNLYYKKIDTSLRPSATNTQENIIQIHLSSSLQFSFLACSVQFFLVFSLIFLFNFSVSQEPVLPKAAIIPVSKDPLTLLYVTQVFLGEKLAPVELVVDVNGPFLWVDCAHNPLSKSQNPIKSCSLECSMAKSSACTMSFGIKSCTLQSENPISRMVTSGNLAKDRISMEFEDVVNSGFMASIDNFLFSCAPKLLLKGLANGAKGVLGLGNTRISLPTQIASTFGFFQRRFSLCLSTSDGLISLAESSDVSLLGGEISRSMVYTPLISKPGGAGEEYKINVKSIKISGEKLSMNQENIGEAKISTTVPYTTMQSKIYGTFVDAYIKAATSLNMTSVTPVAPFGVCFCSKGVENSRLVTNVPIIDLVLQSEMVKWRIYGRNSMVQVSDEIMCLGFLDGGLNQRDPFVIGGYQLEDYVLEFRLGTSMLGISSSLLMEQRKCSDFKLPKEIS